MSIFEEDQLQTQVKELTKGHNVVFYDFSHYITNDSLNADVEHLNYMGAKFFTPIFLNAIREGSNSE